MPLPTVLRARAALPIAVFLLGGCLGGCRRTEEARRTEAGAALPASAALAPSAPNGGASGVTASADEGQTGRADAARILGDSTAPLWMVVVSDFQCPYCKTWEDQTAPVLIREYVRTGRVRMAFVNLPLSMHPNAGPAAEAAMCAGAQDKFWPVHDAIFAAQPRWAPLPNAARTFDSLAVAAGVEPAAFRSCVSTGAMRPIVQADAERATAAGVRSTPSFMISSRAHPAAPPASIEGAAPIESFRAVLDSVLRIAPASGGTR